MRIDAHHHLWDPGARAYPWLLTEDPALNRVFDVDDLRRAIAGTSIEQTVVVQTLSDIAETTAFLSIAAASEGTIAGVIGWVDLTDPAVGDTLAELKATDAGSLLVGVRHQVHDEADPNWLLRPDVRRGLEAVRDAGLVYDLLVRPRELPAAVEAVATTPDLQFVLDHIAKPPIASRQTQPWADLITQLAVHRNVTCKLSGIVTEAEPDVTTADLLPYVDHVIDAFGPDRLMFGSDWPVCVPRRSYQGVYTLALELIATLSAAERDAVLGDNAVKTYGLV
jgi:L-fuconolactonase